MNVGGLTYFPAAHSEEEAHQIRLLLLLKLFDVLEGTHLGCWREKENDELALNVLNGFLTMRQDGEGSQTGLSREVPAGGLVEACVSKFRNVTKSGGR